MAETIFALSTARGRAAVAIIRISGDATLQALELLTGRAAPNARLASVRKIHTGGEVLDEALVLRFDKGASFTGELSAEIQCHGGRAVVDAILRALSDIDGLRLAEPGEFTRRALENGNMDLAEVEGLADLIDADTQAQRKQALSVMGGALSRDVDQWREDLIRARALLEAVIDFADEEVPEDVGPEVAALLNKVEAGVAMALAGADAAASIRDGFEVALIGAPNAGKSTLLNALAGRDAAITSSIAGTTRDVIEVQMELRGLPVTLLDTAGLRDTDDEIEAIGVARARERAAGADLRLFLSAPEDADDHADLDLLKAGDLRVASKSDLGVGQGEYRVSALTGDGLSELVEAVAAELEDRVSEASAVIRERHRVGLQAARENIIAAREIAGFEDMLEIAAEQLRLACISLETILGRVDVEDVLDDIFSQFCLGK